jgi:2-amino-4-hydroxy-6-hydroxymethyldihydropteridine diphosphokinase
MPTCLLGLGANLGDSAATLAAAVVEIKALPDVQLVGHSTWHRTRPVGGPAEQSEYFNGAALIETSIAPLTLLHELQQIEVRHGRTRSERWAPRTLDIDILLYGSEVSETPMLVLPHPRLTFRRFALEPAVELAPKLRHPVIGWPLERLLLHLSAAADRLAIVSPNEALRTQLAELLVGARPANVVARPRFETADHHWPPLWTTWLEFPAPSSAAARIVETVGELPYAAAAFPKLSVLLDADVAHRGADKLQWSTLVRQPGRGPTLRLQTLDPPEIERELLAAVDAVWPDLGPAGGIRLK